MKYFDASKVIVEFRNDVNYNLPVLGRSYTVTHSDSTGEIFVTIGTQYATDKFNSLNDQVLLCMECYNGHFQLNGMVSLDLPGSNYSAPQRGKIFYDNMNIALMAIRYADRQFYERCCFLDNTPIFIHFCSHEPRLNKVYSFGEISEYKTDVPC